MLLSRSFISYMARELTRRLGREHCSFSNADAARTAIEDVIVDELSLEDEINAEVRELLNQYLDYMRQQRIPYQEMFWKVKRQVLAERKVVSAQVRNPDENKMKISRDKVNEMSHKLAQRLPRVLGVRILKTWNETRLEIVRELQDLLMIEHKIDRLAEEKISRQKRDIPEGSEEWTLLHRRYYEEELKRFGIDLAPQNT